GRVAGHVRDGRAIKAHPSVLPGNRRRHAAGPPAGHAALAALARARDVLGAEDPTGAVADAQRARLLIGTPRLREADGPGCEAQASSAMSMSGGPSPGRCSTGLSGPPARSTNRGYRSSKTTGPTPVGPFRR